MDVKYLGDGSTVLVLGKGEDRQVDDGKGNVTAVGTTRVVRLDPTWVEELESDAILDQRPELHPDTGRPLSDTQTDEEKAAAATPEASYTRNEDGTYTRDTDGVQGTFGPSGFEPAEAHTSGRW